jgi:hypothetical protein
VALIRSRSANSIRDRGYASTKVRMYGCNLPLLDITNRKPGKPGCVHVCCTNQVLISEEPAGLVA